MENKVNGSDIVDGNCVMSFKSKGLNQKNLEDMCEMFENLLLSVGFRFSGHVDILRDDE